jgi:O-antigen ligase
MTATAGTPIRALQVALVGGAALLGLIAGMDPKVAVAVALGITFIVVVFADLSVGLALFAFVAFLDVFPLGGFAGVFAKAVGGLLFLSWLALMATRAHERPDLFAEHPVIAYLLILFVGWAALSLLWAEDSAEGLEAVQRFGLNIALFVIAYTAIRKREHAAWVTAAFVAGAAMAALYGITSPRYVDSYDLVRLESGSFDPNQLAATLVAAMVLASALLVGWRRSPPVVVLASVAIAACTAGVFLSLSRGGLVALGVALVAACVLGGRWRPAAVVGLLVVTVLTFGYFGYVATPEARERVTETHGGGTGRTDIWAVGWRMVESEPLHGVGAGNFAVSSIHYLLAPGVLRRDEFIVDEPKVAHNVYLQILAELGVVGLGLFLALVLFSVGSAARATRAFSAQGDAQMELLSRAITVALLAALAADFFISDQFSKQLWLLLALGPSLLSIARRQGAEPAAPAT